MIPEPRSRQILKFVGVCLTCLALAAVIALLIQSLS